MEVQKGGDICIPMSLPTRWSLKACLGALRLNKGALR